MKGRAVARNRASRIGLFLCIFVSGLIVTRCAREVGPRGGPEDKTAPRVVKVMPENKSTLVPWDQEIEFEFSEKMDRKSLEKAVFISPEPGSRVKFKWKGRKLRIELPDSLRADRTYVITLGTDLRDKHRNSLAQSYTLAFSTGEKISSGIIRGRVYAERRQGLLIWAYLRDGQRDPNPETDVAAYVTQTDAHGRFELRNLTRGSYRVFAIFDSDRNRFFETGVDGLGVPFRDIDLVSDSLAISDLNFKILQQDTLGPALNSVAAENATQLTLRFDEALSAEGVDDVANYAIVNRKSVTDTLAVFGAFLNLVEPQEVKLTTAEQTAGVKYVASARHLQDIAGNGLDTNFNSEIFEASTVPDTFRPRLLKTNPVDSARIVFAGSPIDFYFDEALKMSSFEQGVSVQDSSGNRLAGELVWQNPAAVTFQPDRPLGSQTLYRVAMKLDSVQDAMANAAGDSLYIWSFRTVNVDTLSSLSGTISDSDSTATGAILMTARQTQKDGHSYDLKLASPGAYKFEGLLPGTYELEAFRDRDSSGTYTFGHAVPFRPAERFVVYSDSVKIRARWPNEGNDFALPR